MSWILLLLIKTVYQSPFLLSLYKIYKAVIRLATNTSEIYRVCEATVHQLGWKDELALPSAGGDTQDTTCGDRTSVDSDKQPLLALETLSTTPTILPSDIPEDVVFRIDRSILFSKQLEVERRELEGISCNIDELVRSILIKKHFPHNGSPKSPSARVLRACVTRISETHQLTGQINECVQIKYDSTNTIHEQKLIKLWKALLPGTELEGRLTKQWVEIGFQGNDPATDFRGMGLEGLEDLLYYAVTHPESAQKAFNDSRHPVSWYPFAIVGINITQFAVQALRTRQLQYYLYKYGTEKKAFSEFYCYLYHTFNEFWISHQDPQLTVMDFEHKFKEFKELTTRDLMNCKVEPLADYLLRQQTLNEKQLEQTTGDTLTSEFTLIASGREALDASETVLTQRRPVN